MSQAVLCHIELKFMFSNSMLKRKKGEREREKERSN